MMTKPLAVRILRLTGFYSDALANAVEEEDTKPEKPCEHPPEKREPLTMGGKSWRCKCGHQHLGETA